MIKLNEGFSGEGNAVLYVRDILRKFADYLDNSDNPGYCVVNELGNEIQETHHRSFHDDINQTEENNQGIVMNHAIQFEQLDQEDHYTQSKQNHGKRRVSSQQYVLSRRTTASTESTIDLFSKLELSNTASQSIYRSRQSSMTTPNNVDFQFHRAIHLALERDDPRDAHRTMYFCSPIETWKTFVPKIYIFGAIAELFVENATASPSVQCAIDSSGQVEILSTHEQVLQGQTYKGCVFPANDGYNQLLQTYGHRIAEFLSSQGVVDNVGVDFMCVPTTEQEWNLQALEINIRLCGTTHPFMTLKLLTGGALHLPSGKYRTHRGETRYYVATDNMEDPSFTSITSADIIEIFSAHNLHFSHATHVGVVFHLLGCLSEWGKVGVTAIGKSREHAQLLFDQTREVLIEVITTQCRLPTYQCELGL